MRFRTLISWLVILAVLGWAGYTIIGAGSSYIAVSGVVDRAFTEAVQRRKALELQAPGTSRDFAAIVRASIVSGARQGGLVLDETGLVVSEAPGSLTVEVRWSYPVLTSSNSTIVFLPLSVSRSYELPP